MDKKFGIFMIAVFAMIVWKSAIADHDSLHTQHMIESVDNIKNVFECGFVTTKKDMIYALDQAGWISDHYPDIDWNKYEAVIIAPEIYYKNADMVFHGLFREGNEFSLSYGWQRREDSRTQRQHDGTSVYSTFSSLPSKPEILIVAIPKELDENALYCSREHFD